MFAFQKCAHAIPANVTQPMSVRLCSLQGMCPHFGNHMRFDRDSYEPRYFISLDSSLYDKARALADDKLKDSIFRAANTKLIRIRPLNANASSVEEFKNWYVR